MTEPAYIPGMCNINTAEIAYRRKSMWFGIIVGAILLVTLILLHVPWWCIIVILFIPVYIAAIGFLQVRNRFCVAYGASGKQNASENSAHAQSVTDAKSLEADKAKTRKMNTQAALATLVIVSLIAVVLILLN